MLFRNYYRCPSCQHAWRDEWDCGCDDECPSCGTRDISPHRSDELDPVTGAVLEPGSLPG